jgi:hypothetical protein
MKILLNSHCSSLRWKMLVWECGLNNLTAPPLFSTLTTGNSVNTDAWRTIILHITNPQGRWSVCGTSWREVGHNVAALDDRYIIRCLQGSFRWRQQLYYILFSFKWAVEMAVF